MNNDKFLADWHKTSYDRFLNDRLPQLLADRLPLSGYTSNITDSHTCTISVTVAGNGHNVAATFMGVPYPTDEGVFNLNGELRTVVPWIAHSDLDCAAVKCVGELLYDWVDERLGEAADDLPWDEALLRAWLPLDRWLQEFMRNHRHAQSLDMTNWLARQCHLRRIIIDERTALTTPGQWGRVDPFEIPEGPNMGRIFTLSLGASIRDAAIVIDDDAPDAILGSTSSMIPCLEHDDPNRLLMGANMMRQWLPYTEPEPALVQTGNEPNAPHFWCGRNLLTAFIPWGEDNFEDGIVLSESAAQRLSNLYHTEIPWIGGQSFDLYHAIEPGDKLSNRHGAKGVVCRILADDQMPKLSDGTPVELIVSSLRLPGRMNLGQLREAVLGRLARHEGTPVIAPPFHGPSEAEIRQRLNVADLPVDGMETLRGTRTAYAHPSLVGWVYWGRTNHLVRDKMAFAANASQQGQLMGDLEVAALRKVGATETVREHFLTRAANAAIPEELTIGSVAQAAPPTPQFVQLQQRLAAAGIQVALVDGALHFSFGAVAEGQGIEAPIALAQPLPHPWLPEHALTEVGLPSALAGHHDAPQQVPFDGQSITDSKTAVDYSTIGETNDKLTNLLSGGAPTSLIKQAQQQLRSRVNDYLETLLRPEDLRLRGRALFTGRSVLASGAGLAHDQIGLPEEIAWAFFGPQVAAVLGEDAVVQRTFAAEEYLDETMSDAWVILHHAPAAEPTALLAFRPVRMAERAVRLPSLACPLLNCDFDGDQVAVHLPVTEAGQQEAQERLSIAAHLTRDPSLLERLTKQDEAIWGLAYHSLTAAGRTALEQAAGFPIPMPDGFLTRGTIIQVLQPLLAEQGAEVTLTTLRNLIQLGFALASTTGFSLSPFVGEKFSLAPAPTGDDETLLQRYQTQVGEQLLASATFDDEFGPYLLGIKSGANPESDLRTLLHILGVPRIVTDVHGQPAVVRNGFRHGLSPADFRKIVPGARAGMGRIWQQWEAWEEGGNEPPTLKSFHVLARARRVQHPGVVFAQAAATGEVDPLVDEESRLFVGLSV